MAPLMSDSGNSPDSQSTASDYPKKNECQKTSGGIGENEHSQGTMNSSLHHVNHNAIV